MVIEITKEEIEAELTRKFRQICEIDCEIVIDVNSDEVDGQILEVFVLKKKKKLSIYKLNVVKGDIWKRFLMYSMSDGFSILNEYVLKDKIIAL